MTPSQSINVRLTLSRQLASLGLDQSKAGDHSAGLALLALHDSVELFLLSAAELLSAPVSKNADFLSYWDALDKAGQSIPHKGPMRRFNSARVALKHSGILPTRSDIEGYCFLVQEFLNETCPILFGFEFDDISMSSLIKNDKVRDMIRMAEEHLKAGRLGEALTQSKLAFLRALDNKRYRNDPSAQITGRRSSLSPFLRSDLSKELGFTGSRIYEALSSINTISDEIIILSKNLNFDDYWRLQSYGPIIHITGEDNHLVEWLKQPTDDRSIVQKCVLFATDAAIRLED